MAEKPERISLTSTQQRTAIALFQQRQAVLDEANRVLSEIQDAIGELAKMYAGAPGWEFAQDENGALYLRKAEEAPPG